MDIDHLCVFWSHGCTCWWLSPYWWWMVTRMAWDQIEILCKIAPMVAWWLWFTSSRTMWVALEDMAIDANRLHAFMEGKLDMCLLGCLAMVSLQSQPQLLVHVATLFGLKLSGPHLWSSACSPLALQVVKLPKAKHWFIWTGNQARNKQPKGDSTVGLLTFVARPDCL